MLSGHTEEVMYILPLTFKDCNYLLTASQDGSIIKWKMSDDWSYCTGPDGQGEKMLDDITCMAFHMSVLPGCGMF